MAQKIVFTFFLLAAALTLACGIACAQEGTQTEIPTEEVPTDTTTQDTTPVGGSIYFYLNGELSPVPREITGGGQMYEFTSMELLKGPTEEEKAAGYVTYIPEGVKFMSSTIRSDHSEYTVNLSRELLDLSGDPDAAAKALAQIEKTLKEVTGIEKIGITVPADETGPATVDAYEALGVTPSSGQEGEASENGGGKVTALIVAVAVCAALVIILAVLIFLVPAWRKKAAA